MKQTEMFHAVHKKILSLYAKRSHRKQPPKMAYNIEIHELEQQIKICQEKLFIIIRPGREKGGNPESLYNILRE